MIQKSSQWIHITSRTFWSRTDSAQYVWSRTIHLLCCRSGQILQSGCPILLIMIQACSQWIYKTSRTFWSQTDRAQCVWSCTVHLMCCRSVQILQSGRRILLILRQTSSQWTHKTSRTFWSRTDRTQYMWSCTIHFLCCRSVQILQSGRPILRIMIQACSQWIHITSRTFWSQTDHAQYVWSCKIYILWCRSVRSCNQVIWSCS